jgi:hypothetical protein
MTSSLLLALSASTAAPAESFCHANTSAVAVDVSEPTTAPFLAKMRETGVKTIIRYYDHEDETLPGKTLHVQERKAIATGGLKTLVVFQHHNDRFSTFTPIRGDSDARRSLILASENEQPAGRTIYFGVDGAWGTEPELKKIRGYFAAAQKILSRAGFKVGVYGSGRVCGDLTKKKLASYCWLANARSWPDYTSAFKAKKWVLAQQLPEDCGGINVDFNIGNDHYADYGQF